MGHLSTNARGRPAAVAGTFYPGDPAELGATVARLLAVHAADPAPPVAAKAFIVPHAGYAYSGEVAAAAYAQLRARRRQISRVVVIGPSHRAHFRGIALPEADLFETPLGAIRIDPAARAALLARGDVIASDLPHAFEHCIEVQLPFLQSVLEDFALVPLLTGAASPGYVAAVLADVWGGDETLVLVSSDLSHYHPYAAARWRDAATAAMIVAGDATLDAEQACGAVAINGLLARARELGLSIEELARLNSGDTAGDRSRVVGYGAYAAHVA